LSAVWQQHCCRNSWAVLDTHHLPLLLLLLLLL
jgi:hypothetical protein